MTSHNEPIKEAATKLKEEFFNNTNSEENEIDMQAEVDV
jgi:hypothetical protein